MLAPRAAQRPPVNANAPTFAHRYGAFGGVLASTLEFPELIAAPAHDAAHWSFSVVAGLEEMVDPVLLGDEHIYGAVHARLLRHQHGHRIEVDDTGAFDIARSGRDVAWLPHAEPWWDFGRGHLLGRVMATMLHLDGVETLHGSAVRLGSGAVGFLAAKGTGKSTLALQLTAAGVPLMTDDALPIMAGDVIEALPGVPSIRLRTAEETDAPVASTGRDGKFRIVDTHVARRDVAPAPLSALYLLRSVSAAAQSEAVVRARLQGPMAVMQLMPHFKVGFMLGASAGPGLLGLATRLVREVPVFELRVVRERDRLPEVVDQLLEWHGGVPAPLVSGPPAPASA
jgi:hypothetical protein